MRGGTLLILGHRIKGQGQLWLCVYKTVWAGYRVQFSLSHFQTSHVSFGWLEEPYFVLGSRVKSQGQLWHSVYKTFWAGYRLNFFPITFKLKYKLWMMRGETLLILGHGVKVNFGTLCIRPCGHNTVYVQSISNFTCRLWMMKGETRSILGQGVIGQGQICPLRGDATLCVV